MLEKDGLLAADYSQSNRHHCCSICFSRIHCQERYCDGFGPDCVYYSAYVIEKKWKECIPAIMAWNMIRMWNDVFL
jgi:hypothetical protein